jgi:hypothetical protein
VHGDRVGALLVEQAASERNVRELGGRRRRLALELLRERQRCEQQPLGGCLAAQALGNALGAR